MADIISPKCPAGHDLLGAWDAEVRASADDTTKLKVKAWVCIECKRTYDDCEVQLYVGKEKLK